MGLLHEIQMALMDTESELAPIFLKVRFLAAKLGSDELADWIRHESEGYPVDVPVPDYRKLPLSFMGRFNHGLYIADNPIPTQLIAHYVNKDVTIYEMRDSIAAVDSFSKSKEGDLGIDRTELALALQGKVFGDSGIMSIRANISTTQMKAIRHQVRSRLLDVMLKIEQAAPAAAKIELSAPEIAQNIPNLDRAQSVIQQTIHGDYYGATSSGSNARVTVNISKGDKAALIHELTNGGISQSDAEEFAQIVAEEEPNRKERSLGKRALGWLGEKASSGVASAWDISTKALTKAALQYYGVDT